MSDIKRRRRSGEELPLGDAVERLINVVTSINATPPDSLNPRLEMERSQLMEALNTFSVEVGFECRIDLDGDTKNLMEDAEMAEAPTALELIKKGAASSCCRITQKRVPQREDSSRAKKRTPSSVKPNALRGSRSPKKGS
jgi:hypothetical protein